MASTALLLKLLLSALAWLWRWRLHRCRSERLHCWWTGLGPIGSGFGRLVVAAAGAGLFSAAAAGLVSAPAAELAFHCGRRRLVIACGRRRRGFRASTIASCFRAFRFMSRRSQPARRRSLAPRLLLSGPVGRLNFRRLRCRFAVAAGLLWLLGGRAFGGSRGVYWMFLIFEMVCQISLTPRPSMAENGTGS